MSNSNDSILEAYLFETNSLLEQLDSIVLASEEKDSFSEEDVNTIFRIMHTIKGSSAMMEFNSLMTIAHRAEDLFAIIRDKSMDVVPEGKRPELFDLLFQTIDFFRQEIEHIENDEALTENAADEFSDDGPEGAQGAEVPAPAVAQKREVEREDPERGRKGAESRSPNDVAPEEGLRTHRLEGGDARGGAREQSRDEGRVANALREPHEVGVELERAAQRVGEIRDEIHRTDPAAEGARAQDRVEDEDDHGSGERGALREVSRKEALEKRERVRERNRPENERARKIPREELFARDGPAPAGRSDEGEEHENLHEVARNAEAVPDNPFAPGLGGRQMTNFGLHGSTS